MEFHIYASHKALLCFFFVGHCVYLISFILLFFNSCADPLLSLCPTLLQLIFLQVITICCCYCNIPCSFAAVVRNQKNALHFSSLTRTRSTGQNYPGLEKELKREQMFAHINRLLECVCVRLRVCQE